MSTYKDFNERMTFAVSDKLNWAYLVQGLLSDCIRHENDRDQYPEYVKKAYDAVYCDFYGLDLRGPIDKKIAVLNEEYDRRSSNFIYDYNLAAPRRDRPYTFETISPLDRKYQEFISNRTFWYWHNIFEIIRDTFAAHRGLFFGSDDLTMSRQLHDNENVPDYGSFENEDKQ